jgi:hypothetical protein
MQEEQDYSVEYNYCSVLQMPLQFCDSGSSSESMFIPWIPAKAGITSPQWDEICRLIKDPDTLIKALHNRNENNSETKEATKRELQLCTTRLKTITLEQKRLVEGYRKGLYPDFMMHEEMERTSKEQREMEARKNELEKRMLRGEITANKEEAIKNFVKRINDGLDKVDFT